MTRCTEKTLQGKRCKKHASHDGKCLLHIQKVQYSETSSETTVEVTVPTISTQSKWCGHMGCEQWDKLCCECADTRPIVMSCSKYIDSYGEIPIARRDEAYCRVCKNDNEPISNRTNYLVNLHSETVDAIVCLLSRLDKDEINICVNRALQRKRILELADRREE